MQIIRNPKKSEWQKLLTRPYINDPELQQAVIQIINEVKTGGDKAIKKFSQDFDGIALDDFKVTVGELAEAKFNLSPQLKSAIEQACANITKFHEAQISAPEIIQIMPGIACWRKSVGIEKVGLYIPGGSAPLFSTVLMLGIPAKIAGCHQIILCTPPDKTGSIHPAILYTADLLGITDVFKIGGAQAIGAMAFGTDSVTPVNKIFGPGNQYVTMAKQLVQLQGIAIDMPAGPSELCILADETSDSSFIAADLISQAEHGVDSQVILVCTSDKVVDNCVRDIEVQLKNLNRREIAIKALENSKAIIVEDLDEGIELVNEYAPEHLIICCKNETEIAEKIINAGSVFIGNFSPESAGDYASGTNHTLPTNGFARAYSGVSVDSFVKKITFQKLSKKGLKNIAQTVITMAESEGLQGHAEAVKVRMEKLRSKK